MKKLTNLLSLLVMLTMSVSVWAEARTYCGYYGTETKQDGKYCSINWQTNVAGDVVITLSDGPSDGTGYTGVSFRDDCFEGSFDLFKVISSNGEENASVYFTRERSAADNYYILRKNATPLPAGDITIKSTATLAWKCNESASRWKDGSPTFEYIYGTHCQSVATPTNVAVSATGYVTFDNVAGANGYYARIYDGATLVNTQEITNGGLLQFVTTKDSYTVKVVAAIDGFGSEESAPATWTPEAGRVFGVSEYDHFTHKNLNNGGTQVALTWTTDVNGDVVIAISPVAPAKDAILRGYLARTDFGADWKVNGVEASTYFTRVVAADKRSTRLVLKDGAQLPYPCVITLTDQHTEWKGTKADDSESDGYTAAGKLNYSYTYGTTCQVNPGVPGHVSVSGTGRVQHDNVAGAAAYAARFKKDGAIVMQFDITSGEPINWVSTENATYQVTVLAFDAEGNMFDESETHNWTVEAGKVFGKSKYCDWQWNTTANGGFPIYVTWATESNGDMTVTINPVDAQTDANTVFRESMLGRVSIGGEPASNYFNGSYSDNVMTFTLKDPANRPMNGTIVRYDQGDKYLCYKSDASGHGNAYPAFNVIDYIYGTKCTSADAVAPVITTFEKVSVGVDAINFHVEASDVDDEGTPQTITYSLAGDNGFVTTAVTPDGDGNFVVEGLKKNRDYTFTLTVTDPASNATVSDPVVVRMQFDAEDNLALNKPAEASAIQGDGVKAPKANDGNTEYSNFWTPWGNGDANAWWKVDLGYIFELSTINVYWHERANNYTIYGSFTGEDDTWFPIIAHAPATDNTKYELAVNAAARYMKLVANKNTITLTEFEVFGSAYATTDAVAPQVTVTEVEAQKQKNSVVLHIVATDEDDAHVAHPVKSITISGDNGFTTIENAVLDGDGNITLNGLKDNATYNFHVTVTDRVGLTAEQDIEVRVAFNTTTNLALASNGATAEAGCANDPVANVNDDNTNTYWGTYGCGNWETSNVLTVTLAASYNINKIVINVGGTQGAGQILRLEYLDKDENWVVFENNLAAADASTIELPVVVSAQKLRLIGTKNNMIAIKEFEVYGSSYDDGDTEKPVIESVALVGVAGEESAEVSVVATDNVGVYGLQVVDGTKGFDVTYDYIHGQNVTLEGLAQGTTYHFSIFALDRAGNVSDPAALDVTTQANDNLPKTAAPVPTIPAARVTSIYSDAYASAVKDGFQWLAYNSSATAEAKVIAGDNYRHYACGAGGEFAIGADFHDAETNVVGINISTRAALHVDVWSKEAYGQGIGITLNDNRLLLGYQLEAGWNSINVSLAELKDKQDGGFVSAASVLESLKWMKFTEITNKVIAIDNIYFYGVGISENADNTSNITTYTDQTVDIILNRKFAAETLYTLCLPFDMSAAQVEEAFGADAEVWKLVSSEDRGSLIHIDFALQSNIEAGIPYLFNPSKDFTSGTAINNVVLRNTTGREVKTDYFTMKGYVNPTDFTVADGYYFLAADKYLHTLGQDLTSPGLRSAFKITEGADPAAARKPARVILGTEVTTDMPAINAEVGVEKVMRNGQLYIIREGKMYNVQGQLVK